MLTEVLTVHKTFYRLFSAAMLAHARVRTCARSAFRCFQCSERFSDVTVPLSLTCGHQLCLSCIFPLMPTHVLIAASGTVFECPACHHISEQVHMDICCTVPSRQIVACFIKESIPAEELAHRTIALRGRVEALRERQIDEQALEAIRSAARRAGSEVHWWNLMATELILANNAGVRPPRLHHLDVVKPNRIHACAQRFLNESSNPVFRACFANNKRTSDVVWFELVRRAQSGILHFMLFAP